MMTLGGAYSLYQIRQFAFDRGWLTIENGVDQTRWAEIHAAAKQYGITSYELDEAFGLAPGTVAAFLIAHGAESLDAPQSALPQPEAVQPVRDQPVYVQNIKPDTGMPVPDPVMSIPLPVESYPISLPPYDYTPPPPAYLPIPDIQVNEPMGSGASNSALMWAALGLGIIGLLK